jgi:glycosyltransferase involved in cell wall biosynthesis
MHNQRLSIITINLNNASGLQKTFDSIFSQDFTAIEYIVIDGQSEDGSQELIKQYAGKINYCISEKDTGIYNAMNKGISKATGDYLLFLNSGDYLSGPGVVSTVFKQKLAHDIVYGDIMWNTENIQTKGIFPDKLSFAFFIIQSLPHQAAFIKKQVFELVGLYDESYRIISDWIFFLLAICRHNCTYHHLDVFVAVCSRDGMSCDPKNWDGMVSDRKEVLEKYFPLFLADYHHQDEISKELKKTKMMFGYRLHHKLKNLPGIKRLLKG